jgi:hypothetical protein
MNNSESSEEDHTIGDHTIATLSSSFDDPNMVIGLMGTNLVTVVSY